MITRNMKGTRKKSIEKKESGKIIWSTPVNFNVAKSWEHGGKQYFGVEIDGQIYTVLSHFAHKEIPSSLNCRVGYGHDDQICKVYHCDGYQRNTCAMVRKRNTSGYRDTVILYTPM